MAKGLSVIAFPGTGNIVHFVGDEKGFYRAEGIEVALTPTPNSVFQITEFVKGTFDIASTAIDNIVAYTEGQGAAKLDREPDMFVFMGGAQIELPFVVAPGIESYADLKGKTLALDALSTGFAFILYKMLERGGLKEGDFKFVSVGGTDKRWASLEAGEHAGALLNDPFTHFALAKGFRIMESNLDLFDHYQSGCFAARRSWAKENGDALVAFIRAHVRILEWLADPANAEEAALILAAKIPTLAPPAAKAAVAKLSAPRTGFTPKCALDREGIKTVLALRSEYGKPQKKLDDPDAYLDLTYYEEALRTL
jgi:ABC-type nitrate/sulfonate/bicarbonate transport system substrate-binding protein